MRLITTQCKPKVYDDTVYSNNVYLLPELYTLCYGNPIFEETLFPKFIKNENFPEGGDLVKVEWEKRTTITYYCDSVSGGNDYSGDGSKETPYRSLKFIIRRWSYYLSTHQDSTDNIYNFFIKIYIKGIWDYDVSFPTCDTARIYLQPWEGERLDIQPKSLPFANQAIWNGFETPETWESFSFYCAAAINSSFHVLPYNASFDNRTIVSGDFYSCNFTINVPGDFHIDNRATRVFVKSNFFIASKNFIRLPDFHVAQDCTFVLHVKFDDDYLSGGRGDFVLLYGTPENQLKYSNCHFEVHINWGNNNHQKCRVYIFGYEVIQKDCTFSGDVDGLFLPD